MIVNRWLNASFVHDKNEKRNGRGRVFINGSGVLAVSVGRHGAARRLHHYGGTSYGYVWWGRTRFGSIRIVAPGVPWPSCQECGGNGYIGCASAPDAWCECIKDLE